MPVQVPYISGYIPRLFEAGVVDLTINKMRKLRHGVSLGSYIDLRLIESQPTRARAIIESVVKMVDWWHKGREFDVVASVAIGGYSFGRVIAWELNIPHYTVRLYGKNPRQGGLVTGKVSDLPRARVLLIEDTTTTFESVLGAIKLLEKQHAEVAKVLAFATWGLPAFYENAEPYDVTVLATGLQLVDYAEKDPDAAPEHRITTEHAAVLREWITKGVLPSSYTGS